MHMQYGRVVRMTDSTPVNISEQVKAERPKRSKTQFKGIGRHARVLGVDRPYLWLVLTGKRKNRRLLSSYRDVKRAERVLLRADARAAASTVQAASTGHQEGSPPTGGPADKI